MTSYFLVIFFNFNSQGDIHVSHNVDRNDRFACSVLTIVIINIILIGLVLDAIHNVLILYLGECELNPRNINRRVDFSLLEELLEYD